MADFSAFLDKFFKASSLAAGETLNLTIKEVKLAEVGFDKESKPVAYFVEDPRGLVLSANKYKDLTTKTGTRDTDKWVGVKVQLAVDPTVKFQGKVVGGVTLKCI